MLTAEQIEAMAGTSVQKLHITQADKALAKAIYLAYKRSGLPCEGAQLVAAHRIASEQAGRAAALEEAAVAVDDYSKRLCFSMGSIIAAIW